MNQKSRYLLPIAIVMIMIGVILYIVHKAPGNPSGSAESREGTGIDQGLAPLPRVPDSIIRQARKDSLRRLIKDLPIGSRRDSLIAHLSGLRLKHSPYDPWGYAHQTDGRIDTIWHDFRGEIPPEIGELSELRKLVMEGDSSTAIPSQLGELKKLIDLRFGFYFRSIPSFIYQLDSLRNLDLSKNRISGIDPAIGNLARLTRLDMGRNRLNTLPPEIGYLSDLTVLKLGNNPLKSLPVEIAGLSHLDTLEISPSFLQEDNLDPAVVAWLDKNTGHWRRQASPKDLRTWVQDLGNEFLPGTPMYRFAVKRDDQGLLDTLSVIEISAKTLNRILALADSQNLSAAMRKIAGRNPDRISPKEMVRGLLSAHASCERFPYLPGIFRSDHFAIPFEDDEVGRTRPFNWDDVMGQHFSMADHTRGVQPLLKIWEINAKLGDYIGANEFYFRFWSERKRDNSIDAMADLLKRIRRFCYPAMTLDSPSAFYRPPITEVRPVFFDSRSFSDIEALDQHSGFPYRDELLLHFFPEIYGADRRKGDAYPDWHTVKDPDLWGTLLSLHSPYFDSALTYFGLFGESGNTWQWKEIGLKPSLKVKWQFVEGDGPFSLYVHLNFANSENRPAKWIAGIPRREVALRNRKPDGYFLSEKISETRIYRSPDSSEFEVERKYSLPQGIGKLKTLLMVDHVKRSVNPPVNKERNRNRPVLPGNFDPVRSSLFAISDSGDTTLLSRQEQIEVYGDGDLLYYAPYLRTPQFSDLNGDGLADLIVETSGRPVFSIQSEDGFFETQE